MGYVLRRRMAGARYVEWALAAVIVLLPILARATSLDPTFDPDAPFSVHALDGLALQPDGKVLLAGSAGGALGVARKNADGQPDPMFGANGVASAPISGRFGHGNGVAVQADHKVVVAGTTGVSFSQATHDLVLARFEADGTLDASFGTDGLLVIDIHGNRDEGSDVVVRPDGRIVMAARAVNPVTGAQEPVLVGVTASGTLDPGFGVGGIVTTAFPGRTAIVSEMALQPDGRIVLVGGVGGTQPDDDLLVARYDMNGDLDPTFGKDGIVETDLGSDHEELASVTLQPDGKIVAAGYASRDLDEGFINFALVRYETDGKLDRRFGKGGAAFTDFSGFPAGADRSRSVAVQADGRLIVGGYTPFPTAPGLVRHHVDGEIDVSFGVCGRYDNFIGAATGVLHLLLQPDGKPIIGLSTSRVHRVLPPAFACAAMPRTGCRTPVEPFRAKLTIKDKSRDASDRLVWSWIKGAATDGTDFGLPTFGNGYMLCLYDESAAPILISETRVPAGQRCSGVDNRWKGDGQPQFKYSARKGTPAGVTRASLKAGPDGKAQIKIKAKGVLLDIPPLPLKLPVRVQLQSDHGECWEAVYSAEQFQLNTAALFKGKAD